MRIVHAQAKSGLSPLESVAFREMTDKVWKVSLTASVGLMGYLLYALVVGQQAADPMAVVGRLNAVSPWLYLSLAGAAVSLTLLYYEEETLGWLMALAAGVLAVGLPTGLEFFLNGSSAGLAKAPIAEKALSILWTTAMIIGLPGFLLLARQLFLKIQHQRTGQDLLQQSYDKQRTGESNGSPLLGPFATCWQMPLCRAGQKKQCVIFHAKSKCWKEGVGCLCEPNLITTAQTAAKAPAEASGSAGFVPLNDLVVKSEAAARLKPLPTRTAKNGIRIPSNPHLTAAQKRARCRNCAIYTEHQRRKYQLLSLPTTLLAILLVVWQQESLQRALRGGLTSAGDAVAQLTFNPNSHLGFDLTQRMAESHGLQMVVLGCLALLLIALFHHLLEYCVFKLKI